MCTKPGKRSIHTLNDRDIIMKSRNRGVKGGGGGPNSGFHIVNRLMTEFFRHFDRLNKITVEHSFYLLRHTTFISASSFAMI